MIDDLDAVHVGHPKLVEEVREHAKRESDSDGGLAKDRTRGRRETTRSTEGDTGGAPRGKKTTGKVDGFVEGLRQRVRPPDGETEHTATSDSSAHKQARTPVKLLTDSEFDDHRTHLITVYMFLTSLPDDLLEIVVKDHEPVQIWEMDEETATDFVESLLEDAKTDKDAARQVRSLNTIYKKMRYYIYAVPRLIATGRYISEHKGFSLR